jgi:hypothetical protein
VEKVFAGKKRGIEAGKAVGIPNAGGNAGS